MIDGCKRVRRLREGGHKKALCGIIEVPVDAFRAGLLRIGLNTGRALHQYEKLKFIRWLKENLDGEAYLLQVEKLGLLPGERHEYEELLSCNESLVDAVMQGILDPAIAPEMRHISDADAGALIRLFRAIPFSRQMQRELAEWLPEIAFNRGVVLSALLDSNPLAAAIAIARLNAPQKAAMIHDLAHTLRFPLYAKMKSEWSGLSRRINPDPSKVTLHPSPFFERNRLEIRLKGETGGELAGLLHKLAAIDPRTWDELIDPSRIDPMDGPGFS